ncbi:DNA polymerase, partial [Vibrio vulnificus]
EPHRDFFLKNINRRDRQAGWQVQLVELGLRPDSLKGQHFIQLVEEIIGFPRHLSQHVGGFVISSGPLYELVPVENAAMPERTIIQWDKDDLHVFKFKTKLINGMLERGYELDFAERIFEQICGFGEYGFPESHSASFAVLAYCSAWLKHYYPAEFYTALLNSQPMGFYSPSQLVQDAKRHGIAVLPICVNFSNA